MINLSVDILIKKKKKILKTTELRSLKYRDVKI